ncbi:hypothetical protein GCM10007170_25360 [Arthrobacter liuii]|uniref:Uncharacterized protein n=1 Tax=Arthrobacter liuii TaxID=1476996 RepID=A0ABQ2ASR2_9MICC|nr:hypothetical protein GCM10007170_25360 [Arthrobacter liuii]
MLNSLMDLTTAGGSVGIPGLYVTGDPGAADEAARKGSLSLSLAKAVNAKAISLDDASRGYAEFDAGAATKYVLDPNGYLNN